MYRLVGLARMEEYFLNIKRISIAVAFAANESAEAGDQTKDFIIHGPGR